MKTTASNRKLRVLVTGIRNGTLIPNPEFQRRLVWGNRDKVNFLGTVLNGYPFPEIYIASGEIDPDTGEGTEMLVDGQQRISTLYEYFIGFSDLKLGGDLPPYAELETDKKKEFLEYDVVVRDLGQMSIEDIKMIFEKINATSYSLNAMEVHNARYNGELKKFAEEVAQLQFFDNHKLFSVNEVKRMRDLSFVLTFIVTMISSYFTGEEALEEYLAAYNDEFDLKDDLYQEINRTLLFIEKCNFPNKSRVWKKSDFLTLIVELHKALEKDGIDLEPSVVAGKLNEFYRQVENVNDLGESPVMPEQLRSVNDYYKATLQGTNSRGSRLRRSRIIRNVIFDNET